MITLDKFRPISRLEVLEAERTTPRFPVIDAHSHLRRTRDSAAVVQAMDRFGIRLIVDLDGFWDGGLEAQMALYGDRYPGRFAHFLRVNLEGIDEKDFPRVAQRRIRDCAKLGACGIKFSKSLGVKFTDRQGRYVKPDDPRLKAVWETAAELNLPVTIHVADPPSFFDRVIDGAHERYEELAEHPNWSYGDRPCPRFAELLDAQEALLAANPATTFIVAHVGSHAENLRNVSRMLDAYPNMNVDTAERISELGRQPYTARDFLIKYQNRVVYGTDLLPSVSNISGNYRFFETRDEYFPYNSLDEHNQGRWNIYGVFLPDEALEKIYFRNALRLIPRLQGVLDRRENA
jgi:predicted TIM-barrel fold metal-dependent hydrolase